MADGERRIGLAFVPTSARGAVDLIERAEGAGIPTAWAVMPALGLDTPTLFAAAAMRTDRIGLGTAIVPAFTRHPLGLATQAAALEGLAPGRLRLGIGTAHARTMVDVYHLPFDRPLAQLREYLAVLRPLLATGEARFAGEFYRVDAKLPAAPGTPVLISALRAPAFALAGAAADGAISWLCPVPYLRGVALPALARGAAKAGRPRPPLIAHVPVVARADRDEAHRIARAGLASYAAAPFYARMFADAGHPLGPERELPDALLDELVVWGEPAGIADALRRRLGQGLDELLVGVLPGDDRAADERALVGILGGL